MTQLPARNAIPFVLALSIAFLPPAPVEAARAEIGEHLSAALADLEPLAEVVDLYDVGGRVHRPSLSPEIKQLDLSAREKRDLVAFLKTLTSSDPPASIPPLPR